MTRATAGTIALLLAAGARSVPAQPPAVAGMAQAPSATSSSTAPAVASSGVRLVVGAGERYARITDALAAAPDGATVVVRRGVYREPKLVVWRPVALVGEPGAVLDGTGAGHGLVHVRASGVTIRGLIFRNVATSFSEDRAALRIEEATDCVVEGNRFEGTFFGVYLARVSRCAVRGNVLDGRGTAESTSGNGIHLWSSRDVEITGNTVTGHRDGLYLEFTRLARVERNVSRGNFRYGLHFMFSDSSSYRGNTLAKNGAGVAVMYSTRVDMVENRFRDNRGPAAYGLLLKELRDSRVERNDFARNTAALYVEGASRMALVGNRFTANGWGLRLMANVDDATVERNDFAGNTFDVSTNSLLASNRMHGNHFDRYRGFDLDRNGAGDAPFHPVRLFGALVAGNEALLVLQRSVFVDLLDAAERLIPALTPRALADDRPALRPNDLAVR